MRVEIWKDIPRYDGLYQASTHGRIKSLDRKDCRGNRIKGTIMKSRLINSGYYMIHLRDKNGKRKGELVHRLIAETFIDNPNNYKQVNHIDENKKNNYVENLQWVTPKQNTNYGTGILRANIKKSKPVVMLSDLGDILGIFFSATDAARKTNIAQGSITNVCLGKNKHAGGFCWEYI